MDLGVFLESPQGSQASSRVGACTSAFLSSWSSIVALPFAWIKGSLAFPRGFPTRLCHEAFPQGCPTCHRGVSRSSTGKARGTPGSCHHSQRPPDVSIHSRETCFPCTASTFKPRIDSHHGGTWDSPVEKPRGKASWEILEGKPEIP